MAWAELILLGGAIVGAIWATGKWSGKALADKPKPNAHSDAVWLTAELEAGDANQRNAGLWARCFAQAEGNEGKAKALYMTERVRQLGGSVAGQKSRGLTWLKYGLGGLVGLVIVFLVIASRLPDDNGRSDKRAVIDICWKDHKNPALDEATKRFVAKTCNGLVDEYRQQYGSNP